MSMNKGLGRGLNALFGDTPPRAASPAGDVPPTHLPLSSIIPNPDQPRHVFDPQALQELADSIKRQGVLQPLLVRPWQDSYQLVAGERRWRAARMAGLHQVPVIIRTMDDKEVMAIALIENLQREDLNPMEEARALARLQEALGLTQDGLATRLGKSRPAIANAMRLMRLSLAAQDDVEQGRMSAGHARCLLSLESDAAAAETLRLRIIEHSLTVRDTEDAVGFWRTHGRFPWDGESPAAPEASPTAQPAPARQPAPGKRKKDPLLRSLQEVLSRELSCKTRVSGNLESGRLTISYTSPDELRQLLQRLNCTWEE